MQSNTHFTKIPDGSTEHNGVSDSSHLLGLHSVFSLWNKQPFSIHISNLLFCHYCCSVCPLTPSLPFTSFFISSFLILFLYPLHLHMNVFSKEMAVLKVYFFLFWFETPTSDISHRSITLPAKGNNVQTEIRWLQTALPRMRRYTLDTAGERRDEMERRRRKKWEEAKCHKHLTLTLTAL